MLRSRYADDTIAASVREGVEQVVLLGAGFDATAFRLDLPARVFDVDVAQTQSVKRERLRAAGWMPLMRLEYVACQFGADDLGSTLRAVGFEPAKPALFIWMGVVPYLVAQQFETTLAELRELGFRGSRLVMDYVESSVLDGSSEHPGGRRIARMVARRGEPLHSGFTPESLRLTLASQGFAVEQDLGLAELAARYPAALRRYATDGWNRIANATVAF